MSKTEDKLISISILTYRNYRYLYDALDSVFSQDYSNIELIVSDDGSDNFPEQEIRSYINENIRENIKNVIVNHEKINQGTVKHLNKVIELANGYYFAALAGDDVFYDKKTLSTYVENFKKNPGYLIQMAQTAMFDETLTKLDYYYCRPDIIELLKKQDFDKLLEKLCFYPYFPSTSTCFTKALFDKVGKFDEQYRLIEDLPFHIRLMEQRIPILYCDFVAIKHREGGISHGATGALSKTKKMYYQDSLNVIKNEKMECLKKYKMDTEVKEHLKNEMLWYEEMLKDSTVKELEFLMKHFGYSIKKMIQKNWWKFQGCGRTLILFGGLFYFFVPITEPYYSVMLKNIDLKAVYSFAFTIFVVGAILWIVGRIGRFLGLQEAFPECEDL